jgi:hypothetical protein
MRYPIQSMTNRKRTTQKRTRTKGRNGGGSLTGGTGDTNPQYMTNTCLQSGTDTTTSVSIALPIDRLRYSGNKVGVVEALKVWFDWRTPVAASTIGAALTTKSFGATKVQFNEPSLISYLHETTNTISPVTNYPVCFDLTDDAGHGILIATDTINLQCFSASTSATNEIDFKLEYRYKDVTLQEYIGIVQSQS